MAGFIAGPRSCLQQGGHVGPIISPAPLIIMLCVLVFCEERSGFSLSKQIWFISVEALRGTLGPLINSATS